MCEIRLLMSPTQIRVKMTLPCPLVDLRIESYYGSMSVLKNICLYLRVDAVVEAKLDFKLLKTTGHCSTVHGKFLIVLHFLVTTTITDILASKGTLNL